MSKGSRVGPEARLASLLQAADLVREGRGLPKGSPPRKRLVKLSHKGWLILSRAAKELGIDAAGLTKAARECPVIHIANSRETATNNIKPHIVKNSPRSVDMRPRLQPRVWSDEE